MYCVVFSLVASVTSGVTFWCHHTISCTGHMFNSGGLSQLEILKVVESPWDQNSHVVVQSLVAS